MKLPFRKSLFLRVSMRYLLFLFLALGFFIGAAIYYWNKHNELVMQQLNWDLAEEIVPILSPHLENGIDIAEAKMVLASLSLINPVAYATVLDGNGKPLFDSSSRDFERTEPIEITALEEFINHIGQLKKPIYARDPQTRLTPKVRNVVFSVARLMIDGRPGYLFIRLGGQKVNATSETMLENSAVLLGFLFFGLCLVGAALSGILAFWRITRPLRLLSASMENFQRGDYDTRSPVLSEDEVGNNAKAFNLMADTIVENIETLQHVDKQRRDLITTVVHDLRRPLTRLNTSLEMLQSSSSIDPAIQEELIENAQHSGLELKRFIDDLFELSKLEAKERPPEMQRFSLAEFTKEIITHFEDAAEKRNVTITPSFPNAPCKVSADPKLIKRVISNLVENAIVYSKDAGTVSVELVENDSDVMVSIRDTGIGIPKEDIQKIFDRFYRSNPSKIKEAYGSGLGLPIVKSILEAHGSEIVVDSVEGDGSTFSFRLPRA